MLAGKGASTRFIYNALQLGDYDISKILITDSLAHSTIIKSRIKRLGFMHVLNQLLFQVFITKPLKILGSNKYDLKRKELKLNDTPIPTSKTIEVGLVNSDKTIEILKQLEPDVVIVNGTSIISSKVLSCTDAVFINTHVGITPQYRGVHGGYWALRNNDEENFGVTVHLVDKGIDTGSIIYQDTTSVDKEDNFITYPLHQYSLAIPLLKQALMDIKRNELKTYKKEGVESKLYYHPTFTKYLSGLIFKGIK